MSFDDEINQDEANEKLISRQHRIFRNLANSKLTNTQEDLRNRNRDKKLSYLENELKELQLGWKVAKNKVHVSAEAQNFQTIRRHIKCYESLNSQTMRVQTELKMFESQLSRLRCEKGRLCRKTVSDNEHARNIKQAAENVRRLDNRVYAMNVRVGALLQWNRQLRAIAKQVIRERMAFGYLYKKLVDRLSTKKKQLVDMVDQAVFALDGGTDLCKRIMIVKTKSAEDLHFHVNEMKDLMLRINVNEQKYTFFANKGRHNELRELDANECKRRTIFKQAHQQNIERFKRVLDATMEITNECDYVDVINAFGKYEHDFFSYYTYLNELNLHIENMVGGSDVSAKMFHDTDALKDGGPQDEEQTLNFWRTQLNAESERTAEKEEELNELQLIVNGHFDRIKHLFLTLDCARNPMFSEMEQIEVGIENYPTFLAIIEMRLKDVLSQVYYAERLNDGTEPLQLIVRDVGVTEVTPFDRHAWTHLIHQCAECVAAENIQIGRERALPVDNEQLLQMIKDLKPNEVQHRMHHINECSIPRCHMLFVKNS